MGVRKMTYSNLNKNFLSMYDKTYDDEQKKDKILQTLNDLLEKYDWGGVSQKMTIRIRFKGKFWMLDPEVRINEPSEFDKKIPMF